MDVEKIINFRVKTIKIDENARKVK